MPGYDTHYLFGIKAYKKLPDSKIKEAIKKRKNAYILGVLGPDIFFYYATEVVAVRKNIGSVMHTQKTDTFLKNMIRYVASLDERKNSVEIAYLCGFLTHYFLDRECHPYVYWQTDYLNKRKDYLEKHYQFENDIDVALLRIMRDTTPYEFSRVSQIKINPTERERVCRMLHYSMHRTYEETRITKRGIHLAILSIQKEQHFFKLCSGKLKTAIETVENYFVGQSYLASLIPGVDHEISEDPLNLRHLEWKNPWKAEKVSNASFPEMMEKAAGNFALSVYLMEDYLYEFKGDKQVWNLLAWRIGNASYHSGLDWNIPS